MLNTNYVNLTILRPNTLKTCSHSPFFFFFLLHSQNTVTSVPPINKPTTMVAKRAGVVYTKPPSLLSPVIGSDTNDRLFKL